MVSTLFGCTCQLAQVVQSHRMAREFAATHYTAASCLADSASDFWGAGFCPVGPVRLERSWHRLHRETYIGVQLEKSEQGSHSLDGSMSSTVYHLVEQI